MSANDIYEMTGPTEWASPPEQLSFSSMRTIEECPLRWQLTRSRYGELPSFPARPSPAALVGKVVHALLERLFRRLASNAFPAIGSADFQRAMVEVDIHVQVREALAKCRQDLAAQPRSQGITIPDSELDVYNKLCRIFKPIYRRMVVSRHARRAGESAGEVVGWLELLRRKGTLTEVRLTHPELPLVGVIDLMMDDGGKTRIIDFKTGAEKPEHREQVMLYALFWFRRTGDLPETGELYYADSNQAFPVSNEELTQLEDELARRITKLKYLLSRHPAEGRRGLHCRHCDVRQFCDAYWSPASAATAQTDEFRSDLEATVLEQVPGGWRVSVSYPNGDTLAEMAIDELVHLAKIQEGDLLRILGGRQVEGTQIIKLTRLTEVFRQGSITLNAPDHHALRGHAGTR